MPFHLVKSKKEKCGQAGRETAVENFALFSDVDKKVARLRVQSPSGMNFFIIWISMGMLTAEWNWGNFGNYVYVGCGNTGKNYNDSSHFIIPLRIHFLHTDDYAHIHNYVYVAWQTAYYIAQKYIFEDRPHFITETGWGGGSCSTLREGPHLRCKPLRSSTLYSLILQVLLFFFSFSSLFPFFFLLSSAVGSC